MEITVPNDHLLRFLNKAIDVFHTKPALFMLPSLLPLPEPKTAIISNQTVNNPSTEMMTQKNMGDKERKVKRANS